MQSLSIPSGTYKKFLAKGDLRKGAVYDAWCNIWKQPLKRSYQVDFEFYGHKAHNPADAEVEIYIGIN